MLPLFDMIRNAQDGRGVEVMARQFGLSTEQAEAAIEALTPALSQGLKRNAADPYGVGAFVSALSTGQHAKYFEDAGRAASAEGIAEGNGILGHLFGSKALSRAVAGQAAEATGVAQETLKQMLPALAAMIMGGLFKQSTGQMQGASGAHGQANPIGAIIEQMMLQPTGGATGSSRTPRPEAPQPGMNPFDNPFGRALEGMFGGASRAGGPGSPPPDNPLGRIFAEMMSGVGADRDTRPSAPPRGARANPSGRPRTPYDDLFGEMFESGARQRDQYQKSMEAIVDRFLSGMERSRRDP